MKKILSILTVLCICGISAFAQNTAPKENIMKDKKVLVAFFSRTGENYNVGNISKGNTHIIAEMIAGENYDVIFLGYPNWWGDMPMAVYTFIEKHDWNGKTVIPFCTHEGSGLSGTERLLEQACKGATIAKGLAVQGTTAQNSQAQAKKTVQSWLNKLK